MCGNSDSKSSESGGHGNGKKRAKIPKRGPGVAKLEEMRREEEKKDTRRRETSLPSSSCLFLHPSNPQTYNNSNYISINTTALARHNHQCPPHMMHQFLGSSSSPSSSSLPFPLHNPILEPPSNQSSYHNLTSWAPQEQRVAFFSSLISAIFIKIVNMKRPYPSSLDNSVVPPPQNASSFASSNDCRRDANWGSPSRKMINSDNAGAVGPYYFLPFGSSHLPSPPMHSLHCDANEVGNQFHKERSMEDKQRRCESSGCEHKPFYNFLEVKEVVRLKKDASNHDEGSDKIDLDLKL
ncbi:optomotor-blind protein-like isoform X1 [Senna tora]|uniref:Optomotor-blind protein-like isoform X1 n=1 Tax=Senna tora TaxID=362788 RepID=A0A834SG19_9FABA|nr:optomotor-blind protein-like isoform X1 [Senna tora]